MYGEHSSLALDGSDQPHIAHIGNGVIRYVRKTPFGWQSEFIDPAAFGAMYTSLALDGEGWPRLAYYHLDWGVLEYAYKDATGWHREVVDAGFGVGLYASLRVDGAGRPRIAYHDASNLDLKYARMLPGTLLLQCELTGGVLLLSWAPFEGASEFWVFGASNEAHFVPGGPPDFAHRLAQLPSGVTAWSSANGVGDPTQNWTYLVMAVNSEGWELARSGRVGEHDFHVGIP